MSSDKKIKANRLNSKKSTGPKSIAGKKRSSLNSIKHGLTCEKNVCIGENKKECRRLYKEYVSVPRSYEEIIDKEFDIIIK